MPLKKKTTKKTPRKKSVLKLSFKNKPVIHFIKQLIARETIRKIRQESNSLSFESALKGHQPATLKKHGTKHNKPLFRVATANRGPISTAGNLAFGGRYNVGGSQQIKSIGIRPFAALYLSTDLQCAISEHTHGTPLALGDKKYRLTPSKELTLWDIEKIIKFIQYPNLRYLLDQGPLTSDWGYCKVPMQSQILGYWLKQIGGDGVIFNSTQSQNSRCIAIFAKDDNHAKKLFSQIKEMSSS